MMDIAAIQKEIIDLSQNKKSNWKVDVYEIKYKVINLLHQLYIFWLYFVLKVPL